MNPFLHHDIADHLHSHWIDDDSTKHPLQILPLLNRRQMFPRQEHDVAPLFQRHDRQWFAFVVFPGMDGSLAVFDQDVGAMVVDGEDDAFVRVEDVVVDCFCSLFGAEEMLIWTMRSAPLDWDRAGQGKMSTYMILHIIHRDRSVVRPSHADSVVEVHCREGTVT